MNSHPYLTRVARGLFGCVAVLLSGGLIQSGAQQAPANAPAQPRPPSQVDEEEDVYELSPFFVEASEDDGYRATSTLAGTRLRSDLRDLGSAISVVTEQFMTDTNSKNVEDLLVYTTNTEIGGTAGNMSGIDLRGGGSTIDETGNFTRQDTNNRIRGLGGADNTRNFARTDIPSDSYNTGRWDIQRGPNSILFGLGKAAGVINAGLKEASFKDSGKFENRIGIHGSMRNSIEYNKVLLEDELAVRFAGLVDNNKYRQDPTFEDSRRIYGALRYEPKFLAKNGMKTTLRLNYEDGEIEGMRPRTLPPIDRLSAWFRSEPFQVPGNALIGKPAASYPAMNRALYDNWLAGNRTNTADRNWNYGDIPKPPANIINPDSGISMFPGGRHWINPSNLGQNSRTYVNGWTQNPTFQPFLAEVWTPGALGFSNADGTGGSTTAQYSNGGATGQYGINNGTTRTYNTKFTPIGVVPNGGVGYFRYAQPLAITTPWLMYRDLQLPFGGLYRDPSLTDRGVFDFINNNLDGDTRRNWRNFDALGAALDQTFLNNRVGVSLSYDHQDYDDGSHSIFNDRLQTVTVDLNATMPASSLPNPNAGRAMMVGDGNYGTSVTEREELRATVFAEVKATDFLPDGRLASILGRHILTGVATENTHDVRNDSYRRFMLNPDDLVGIARDLGASNGGTAYRTHMYLTPDSMTDTAKYPTLSSARIQPPQGWTAPTTVNLQYFDSNWNRPTDPTAAGYVDPNAAWLDPFPLDASVYPNPVSNSNQRNNPDNYVGWTTKEVRLLDATNPEDRKRMQTNWDGGLSMSRSKIESKAFVWQGFFFDGHIVPTFGYREDTSKAYSFRANNAGTPGLSGIYRPADILNPTSGAIAYPANPGGVRTEDGFIIQDSPNIQISDTPDNILETINRSWSVVAHAPQFIRDYLPWGTALSLSYNESTNFDPGAAGRRNLWNEPLASPGGKTRDVGLLVSMLENRINFRVVKYKSSIQRNSLSIPGFWHQIEGRSWVAAKKMLDGINAAATYDYQYNDIPGVARLTSAWDTPAYLYGTIDPTDSQRIIYASQAEKDALLARGREMANRIINGLPSELATAWNIDTTSEQWRTTTDIGALPSGATSIQDRTSEGWEFETTVRPLDNWRVTANMSTTKAVQTNSYSDIKDYVFERDEYWSGPAGDFYYSSPGRETTSYRDFWAINVTGAINQRLLADGAVLQEAVRKRFNLVTSYDFKNDQLKGLTIGGGYRWEDKAAIGYYYKTFTVNQGTQTKFFEVPDLEKPIFGESQDALDLWVGYSRKLSDKLHWRVQLNMRNVGDSADLVPISTQPDGSVAQYRIKDGQSWAVTNTFSF